MAKYCSKPTVHQVFYHLYHPWFEKIPYRTNNLRAAWHPDQGHPIFLGISAPEQDRIAEPARPRASLNRRHGP